MLTVLFGGIALLIIVFFILFGTTRKAQCQGVLLPTTGVIRMLPPQAGVIKEIRVKEGQMVRQGDVLFVLSSERSTVNGDSTEKIISNLLSMRLNSFDTELAQSQQQARHRLQVALRRSSDLKMEIARIADQIALQNRRIELAEQAYRRYSDLLATHYISPAQAQDKQGELLDQRQRLGDLERIKSSNERELASAQADARDRTLQSQRDRDALERNRSTVEQDLTENEARQQFLLRAPQDGIVTAITLGIGQTVSISTALASLLPAGAELEAEIYVPSRSAGFLKPGMAVLLRYQAYPYQKFGQYRALVKEVSGTSLRPEELALPGAGLPIGNSPEPLYRVRLKLERQTVLTYGKALPLKSGMLLNASIVLEHRRLYEWVLEPLFSISGRI